VTIVALHPEELLDRDARGELSPAEMDRLALHLRACAVCRLERTLRADFQQNEEPLGTDFDVHGLLSRVLAPGASWEPERLPRASAMRRMRPVLLVAALLFVAGASVAAGWGGMPRMRAQSGSQEVNWKAPAATRAAPVPVVAAVVAPVPTPPADVPVLGAPAPVERVAKASVKPPLPDVKAGLGGSSAPFSDAASLFAQANAVRRSGDHAGAADLYRALIDRFPRSAEAHEAEASLGRLQLSDGNASAAVRFFDEYLYAGGPLEEDVRVDRALALGRLHRPADEAEAWSTLLRAHPASVRAERARARLRELGER
jgi:TolA-binding protein